MRIKSILVLVLLSIMTVTTAFAMPNMSGTWVMQSKNPVTIVIKQSTTTLSIDYKVGNRIETAVHKLDGSESVNKSPSGKNIKSTVSTAGSTIVIKSLMEGTAKPSIFVYSLSSDGKILTIETTIATPNGERKQTLTYNKQ